MIRYLLTSLVLCGALFFPNQDSHAATHIDTDSSSVTPTYLDIIAVVTYYNGGGDLCIRVYVKGDPSTSSSSNKGTIECHIGGAAVKFKNTGSGWETSSKTKNSTSFLSHGSTSWASGSTSAPSGVAGGSPTTVTGFYAEYCRPLDHWELAKGQDYGMTALSKDAADAQKDSTPATTTSIH